MTQVGPSRSDQVLTDGQENNENEIDLADVNDTLTNESSFFVNGTETFNNHTDKQNYIDNLPAFKSYDLHIYSPADMCSSIQIHLLHCYDIING
ncbi:hypothetical protein HDV02_000652, partial [Globomyces sp. JEL0801]